jgi:hypothetical protein
MRLTPQESEQELQDYSYFLLKWMGYVMVFIFGLGMGLWIGETYACGYEEPEPIVITVEGI